MYTARQFLLAAFAGAALVSPAQAETAVYDGLTFAQLKSALSSTKVTVEEKQTPKGNPFLIVTVPGAHAQFIASMLDCAAPQGTCEGYAYFYIETQRTVDLGKFASDYFFVKAVPMKSDTTHTVLQGEFMARGGIAERQIQLAGAYFTAVIDDFLAKSTPTAMNNAPSISAMALAKPMQVEPYFAALAARGSGMPVVKVRAMPAEIAMVDELAGTQ